MLTPSVNVVQSSFAEEQQGEISGLSRSVSNLGSSLGTAIAGTILVAGITVTPERSYGLAMVVLAVVGLVGLVAAAPTAADTGTSRCHSVQAMTSGPMDGGPPTVGTAVGRPPCSLHCKVRGGHPRLPAASAASKLSELQLERQLDLGLGRRRHVARDHLSACALIPTRATGDRQREVQRPVDDRALGCDLSTGED